MASALELWQKELKEWRQHPLYLLLMSWYELEGTPLMQEVNRVYTLYIDDSGVNPLPKRFGSEESIGRLLKMAAVMGFEPDSYDVTTFSFADQQTLFNVSLTHSDTPRVMRNGAVDFYEWHCSAKTENEALFRLIGQAVEEIEWHRRKPKI